MRLSKYKFKGSLVFVPLLSSNGLALENGLRIISNTGPYMAFSAAYLSEKIDPGHYFFVFFSPKPHS